MVHKYFMPRGGPPYAPQTFDVRGGPASLRIHTQARGAEFTKGYKWNIRVTQVYSDDVDVVVDDDLTS